LRQDRNVTAQPGIIGVVGTNASLLQDRNVTAQFGTVGVTGISASLILTVSPDVIWQNLVNASAAGSTLTRTTAGDPIVDKATADSAQAFQTKRVAFRPVLGASTSVGLVFGFEADGDTAFRHRFHVVNHPTSGYYADALTSGGSLLERTYFTGGASGQFIELELTVENCHYYVNGVRVATQSRSALLSGGARVRAELRNLQNDRVQDVTLSAATIEWWLTASVGVVPIAGTSANLNYGYVVAVAPGTLSIAGVDASLNKGQLLSASAGAVPVAGVVASLLFGRLLDAQEGVLGIVGINANLLRGGMTLSASPGVVSFAAPSATLNKGQLLTAQAGVMLIGGTDASLLLARRLIADDHAMPIVGVDATLGIYILQSYDLTADEGAVSIFGQAASFSRQREALVAQAGAWPFSGQNAMFFATRRLTGQRGIIPIFGVDAELIGVEPGAHSTDLIELAVSDLNHLIETP
jgi:hypothetical protein